MASLAEEIKLFEKVLNQKKKGGVVVKLLKKV